MSTSTLPSSSPSANTFNPLHILTFIRCDFPDFGSPSADYMASMSASFAMHGAADPFASKHMCNRCGKIYSHGPGLSRHRRQCNGLFDYACTMCNKMYYRRDAFKVHMSSKHGVDLDETILPQNMS